MADNISELYRVASKKGVLANGLTEDKFRQKISTDEGLRSFYDYASSHGMKLRPWEDFRNKTRGNSITQKQTYETSRNTAYNPSVKDNPAPTNNAEYRANLDKQWANEMRISPGQISTIPAPGSTFGFNDQFVPNEQVITPPNNTTGSKPQRVHLSQLPKNVQQQITEMTPAGAVKRDIKRDPGFRTVAEYNPKTESYTPYSDTQTTEEMLQKVSANWLNTYQGMNRKAQLDNEVEAISNDVMQEVQDNFMNYPLVQWQVQAYKEGKLTREQFEDAIKKAGSEIYRSELNKRTETLYKKFQDDLYNANKDVITSELYRLGEIESPVANKKDNYWKDFGESMAAGIWHIARFPEQAVGAFEDWTSGAAQYILNNLTFNGFGGRIKFDFASQNNGIGRRFIHNYLGGDFAEWREKYYRKEAARFDDDIDFFTEIKNGKWKNAIEKLGLSTAENTPNLALSVAAAAAGYPEPAAGLLAGQASFDKWEEIANDNSLSPEDKAVSVMGTFLAEYFFERLGDMRYQKMFGNAPTKEIQNDLRKSGIKAWDKFANSKVGNILGTGWNTAMEYAGESITEMATELSEQCLDVYLGKQDSIDWNAVGYAGVVAMASDAPLQMTHGVMNTHHRNELQKDIESNPELVQFANEKGMNVEQIVDLLVKKEKGGSFDQKESEIYQEFVDKSKEVAEKTKEKRDIYIKAVEELAKEEGLEVEDVLHQIEVDEKAQAEDIGLSGMDMYYYRNILFDKLEKAGFFDGETPQTFNNTPSAEQQAQAHRQQMRQQAEQNAQAEVQSISHEDGNVYYVGIKGKDGAEGYAVSGNLDMQQDQQGMYGTRGRDLVTVKLNDGSVEQVPADELVVRDLPVSANELMQEKADHLFAQYANNDLFQIGDKVHIMQDGQPSEDSSTIVNITDEGVEVEIIDPNGQPNTTVIPHEQAAEMLSKDETGTEDGIVTFTMQDGNTVRLRDMGDGTFASIVSEGEQPEIFTEEELAEAGAVRADDVIITTPDASLEQRTERHYNDTGNVTVETQEPAYPTDEEGNPAWNQIEVPQAAQILYDTFKQNNTAAISYADDQLKEAQKVQKKAASQTSHNLNLAARLAEDEQNAQFKAAADAAVKYWQDVKLAIGQIKTAEEQAAKEAQQLAMQQAREQRSKTEEGTVTAPTMAERYAAADKIEGNTGTMTLPDGRELSGRYMLIAPQGVTPSHDVTKNYQRSEGYPVTSNGQSINDRDYTSDQEEQQKVQSIAQNFNGNAIKNMPVISDEGLVYNGNGRMMAGQLAALNGTDAAYTQSLMNNAAQYGFTPEQVASIPNARVVFQLDERLPYSTQSLAIFNEQETQTQSNTGKAAGYARKLTPQAVSEVLAAVDGFNTIDAFFSDKKAPFNLINSLINAGIIAQREKAEMVDGDKLSATGRERLSNILFGTVFDNETIRLMGDDAALKNSILRALPQILDNKSLGEFSLEADINDAIRLLYQVRNAGMPFRSFVSQTVIAEDGQVHTAAEGYTPYQLLLAEEMSEGGVDAFRDVLTAYNNEARNVQGGQVDIFGDLLTPTELKNLILQRYGKEPNEQERPSAGREADNPAESTPASNEPAAEVTEPAQPAPQLIFAKNYYKDNGAREVAHGIKDNNLDSIFEAADDMYEALKPYINDMVNGGGITFIPVPSRKGKADTNFKLAALISQRVTNQNPKWRDGTVDVRDVLQGNERESLYDIKKAGRSIPEGDFFGYRLTGELPTRGTIVLIDGVYATGATMNAAREVVGSDAVSLVYAYDDTAEVNTPEAKLAQAEAETDTNPTEAQKKAENYKQGHVTLWGLPITIENPRGSIRRGTDANGKKWEQKMNHTYGKIRRTEGEDGDHIDVFIGPNLTSDKVFVVDQRNVNNGEFDEHKVMLGFDSLEDAQNGYLSNYEEGWQGMGTVTEVTMDEFKKWIDSSHRKTKPFAEYKSVKTEGAASTAMEEQPDITNESAQAFIGKDVADVRKALGHWWILDSQKAGQYIFDRAGYGRLQLSTDEKGIVTAAYFVSHNGPAWFAAHPEQEQAANPTEPLNTLADVKKFMDSIGYDGTLSKVLTDADGKKFVKFQANGAVTPNIYLGETTPRDIFEQFYLYDNVMEVDIPADIQAELERQSAAAKEVRDELWAEDREQVKQILSEEGIPFVDVIDSEMGSRIIFTDRKNENGNYIDYMDVSDADQARENIEFIRTKAESFAPKQPVNVFDGAQTGIVPTNSTADAIMWFRENVGKKFIDAEKRGGANSIITIKATNNTDVTLENEWKGAISERTMPLDEAVRLMNNYGYSAIQEQPSQEIPEASNETLRKRLAKLVNGWQLGNREPSDGEMQELRDECEKIVKRYKAPTIKAALDAIEESVAKQKAEGAAWIFTDDEETALYQVVKAIISKSSNKVTKNVEKPTKNEEKVQQNLQESEKSSTFAGVNNNNNGNEQQSNGGVSSRSEGESGEDRLQQSGLGRGDRASQEDLQTLKELLDGKDPDEQQKIARQWAEEHGVLFDLFQLINEKGLTDFPGGNENSNWIDKQAGVIYKMNNLMNSKNRISVLLERVALYNQLFPETRLDFVGLATVAGGRQVYPVYSQVFVAESRNASVDEIKESMHALGFEPTGKTDGEFSNEQYIIGDARPRNVLVRPDNKVVYVDVDVTLAPQNEPTPTKPKRKQEQTTSQSGTNNSEVVSKQPRNQQQANFESNSVFTADAVAEARKRLAARRNRLNMGLNPEDAYDYTIIAGAYVEQGVRKFADFCKAMIQDLGDAVRPYLQSIYDSLRHDPQVKAQGWNKDFDSHDVVDNFDVDNFAVEEEQPTEEEKVRTPEEIAISKMLGTITKSKHTKTGEDLYVVSIPQRVSDDEFKVLKARAKANNGYYSSFAKNRGFVFKDYEDAKRFNTINDEEVTDAQTSANTEAVISQAETVAAEAAAIETPEQVAPEVTPEAKEEQVTEVQQVIEQVDDAVEQINEQLALLGYYEADTDDPSKWNESYGFIRSAEAKALKDIDRLAKQLAADLGIEINKRKKIASANLAPAGGDISFRLPLSEDGKELYLTIDVAPNESWRVHYNPEGSEYDLVVDGLMWRVEDTKVKGFGRYPISNQIYREGPEGFKLKYKSLLDSIRRQAKDYLPKVEETSAPVEHMSDLLEEAKKRKAASEKRKKDKTRIPDGQQVLSLFDDAVEDLTEAARKEEQLNDNNDGNINESTEGASRTTPEGSNEVGSNGTESDGGQQTGTAQGTSGRRDTGRVAGSDAGQNGGDAQQSSATGTEQPRSKRGSASGTAGGVSTDHVVADPTVEHGDRRADDGSLLTPKEKNTPKNTRNYLYPEDAGEIDNMSPMERLETNVQALEVLRTLLTEDREATPEERATLGKLRGWGGINVPDNYTAKYTPLAMNPLQKRLVAVVNALDPNGERKLLESLQTASLTSYYTPIPIARAMHAIAEQAGYKGNGNMLDPSMGNGVFEGSMAKGMQQSTNIRGVELDWLTGQIAQKLYPDARINITGFQDAHIPQDYYDYVVSNIPFGSLQITDLDWQKNPSPIRKAAQGKIHNYFAVKMIESTRPGGLCVIMTSNAIMDTAGNDIIRKYITDNCEVLGAVRLPNNTFKGAGTRVVTDVIYLRKFRNAEERIQMMERADYWEDIATPFNYTEPQALEDKNGGTHQVRYSKYYQQHPENIIGTPIAGGQYSDEAYDQESNLSTDELAQQLETIGRRFMDERKKRFGAITVNTTTPRSEIQERIKERYKGNGRYESSGNIVVQDGKIGKLEGTKEGNMTQLMFAEQKLGSATVAQVTDYANLRSLLKQLIHVQIENYTSDRIDEVRKQMQQAYTAYTKKYGKLCEKKNAFIEEDIDGYQVRALEQWKDGKFVGMADIYTKNTIASERDMNDVSDPQAAVLNSLAEYGNINTEYLQRVLGDNFAEACKGLIFEDPSHQGEYIARDVYLSGDVVTKLEYARQMAEEDSRFQENVTALEAIQPKRKEFGEFPCHMGARWIPVQIYNDFLNETFGIRGNWKGQKTGITYVEATNEYIFNFVPSEFGGNAAKYATSRKSASDIFQAALLDKDITVKYKDEDGKEHTDQEATDAARDKVAELRDAFEDWVPQKPERVQQLTDTYNSVFNRHVLPTYNGQHLNIVGLQGMKLRPHQKDAVWRIINQRGGIVDHIVGAGKSLVMQASIMEMRRMGIAKKPMILALKSTTQQIANEFRQAFPAARVLAPTEADFSTQNRKRFLAQIAVNDYDCIILSHEQYSALDHTEAIKRSFIEDQIAQLDNLLEYLYGQKDESQLTKKQIKGLEKRKENLKERLKKLELIRTDEEFVFENLGVDYLFVDECQAFKNLMFQTSYSQIAGLGNPEGSERSTKLLYGVRALQEMHQGDMGTVFLSGTTITNSLSELYNIFNYLRPNEMARMGLNTFDAWASTFAVRSTEAEFGATNELKEKSRFRKFEGLQELSRLYTEIADVRNDNNLELPKPKLHTVFVSIPISDTMKKINDAITDMVKNHNGSFFNIHPANDYKYPWSLSATNLAKLATLSPKLIDPSYDDENGKIFHVCENIKKIYDQFNDQKGVQLVFCDAGVPGPGKKYDAYTDIIRRLTKDYGIPRSEIADIHEAGDDAKRQALFKKVNEGKVRIVIGGTKNMGTGVNVQQRVVAMHHLDIPWTPADVNQRNGRGSRQGNEIARDYNNNQVDAYYYAVERTLDTYRYQLQDVKGKMIDSFKMANVGVNEFDEGGGDDNMSPAEMVAILSGNPVILDKAKQDKLVDKLKRLQRSSVTEYARRKGDYEMLQKSQSTMEGLIRRNAEDIDTLKRNGYEPDAEGNWPTLHPVLSEYERVSSGKTFEKPTELGAAIHARIKETGTAYLYAAGISAKVMPYVDANGETKLGEYELQAQTYSGVRYTVKLSDDDTAAGQAMQNLLRKIYTNADVYKRRLEEVNNKLEGADPGEYSFPRQAELDAALAKKREIDAEYNKLIVSDKKPKQTEEKPEKQLLNLDYDAELTDEQQLATRALIETLNDNTDLDVFLATDEEAQSVLPKTPDASQVENPMRSTYNTQGVTGETPELSIKVNHNSPYLLKKADGTFVDPVTGEKLGFDHRFMGEGEGGQAHGWGSYFSVDDIRRYAIPAEGLYTYKGRNLAQLLFWKNDQNHFGTIAHIIQEMQKGVSVEDAIAAAYKDAKELLAAYKKNLNASSHLVEVEEDRVKMLENLDPEDFQSRGQQLHHYDVEIPEDNGENYLDEMKTIEKPLRRKIADAVRNLEGSPAPSFGYANYRNGWESLADMIERNQWAYLEVRDRLVQAFGGGWRAEKRFSEMMHDLGFVGVRYNGRRDGECYVIFNENDAKITDHRQFMRTSDGTLYGWAIGDRIYLTKAGLNPNTPIHEYTHLWAKAMRRNNQEGWQSIVNIFKDTPFWQEVVEDENYAFIRDNDDAICSEVLARYSGTRGAARMEEAAAEMLHEADQTDDLATFARTRRLISRVRQALSDFWHWVGVNLFGIKHFDSAEQVADRVLFDMLNGTSLQSNEESQYSKIATDAWNKYQYDGELESVRDVAEYIEENMQKDDVTAPLFNAIDKYRAEEEEDRLYYGERGDLEPFENAIFAEIEKLMDSDIERSVSKWTPEQMRAIQEWNEAHPHPQYQVGEKLDHYAQRLHQWEEARKQFRASMDSAKPSAEEAEKADRPVAAGTPAFVPGIKPTPTADESPAEYALRLKQYYQLMRDETMVADYVAEINAQADAAAKGLKKNTLVRGLLDAAKPIENFQEWMTQRGATMTDESNAYTDTFLASGRVSQAHEQLTRDILRPLAKQIATIIAPDETGKSRLDGINITWQNMDVPGTGSKIDGKALTPREIIGVYCQAKDCAEAIEKGLPDRGAKGFERNLGMTHDQIISEVESRIPRAELDEMWRLINAATHFALNYDYESGRISEDTHTEFYQREFYVPQRGWRERDESALVTEYEPVGKRGHDPYNAALVKAHGRQSLAADPFAYIMSIDASSIISSENNKIKQKFLRFCLDNEDLGLKTGAFRIKKYWIMNVIDPETGRIKLDADGNPMMEVSYSAPSTEDLQHDKETKQQIQEKRKQLSKVRSAFEKQNEHGDMPESLQAAYETKIARLEQAIEDLENQMHIAWHATNTNISQRTSDEKKQHEVQVLLDGEKYVIELQDEKLANAINKKFKQHQESLFDTTQKMRNATRFMSAMLTQYNPEFAASNFARDYQVALATLMAEHRELVGPFMKYFATCQGAVWKYAFNDKVRDREAFADSEMGKYLREYFASGAPTGFSYMQDLKSLRRDFDAMVNESNIRRGIKGAVGVFAMLTEVSETAVRFAGFVAARKNGVGINEAAYLSKELTTNFDRAGELADSGWMSWFSFFRATLNGNLKFLKALKKMPLAYSIVAASYFAMGMLNQFLNPDDPDDEIWASDYTRQSNFVIGKWRIPTAHFLRMFFAAGVNAAQWMQGDKTFGHAVYNTADFAANEMLPNYLNVMNGTEWNDRTGSADFTWKGLLQGVMPSPVSPIADVWFNRDFRGATINREPFTKAQEGTKDILLSKDRTLPVYKWLTQTIYEGVGGNMNTQYKSSDPAWRSWLFDTSASSVEHVTEGYMPAAMDMFITVGEAIYDAATGTPTGPDKWPFVRKFYNAYTPERAYMQQYYLLNGRVKEFERNLKDYQKNDPAQYRLLRNSQEYRTYQQTQSLVKSQSENPTTADVRALIEANKLWLK